MINWALHNQNMQKLNDSIGNLLATNVDLHTRKWILIYKLVKTGNLLRSISSTAHSTPAGFNIATKMMFYGPYLNYGTKTISPRPFWTNGLQDGIEATKKDENEHTG